MPGSQLCTCPAFLRASNPPGSVKPGISWAEERLLQSYHCYFWASPVLFSLDTRCCLKEMGLPCTLSSLKRSSRALWSPVPGPAVPGESQSSPSFPVVLQDWEGVCAVAVLLWGHRAAMDLSLSSESVGLCMPGAGEGAASDGKGAL